MRKQNTGILIGRHDYNLRTVIFEASGGKVPYFWWVFKFLKKLWEVIKIQL